MRREGMESGCGGAVSFWLAFVLPYLGSLPLAAYGRPACSQGFGGSPAEHRGV
jgi:hypothetical protein